MISLQTYGCFKYPSDRILPLLTALEKVVLQTIQQEQLSTHTFGHIAKNMLSEKLSFIGCDAHRKALTRRVISYYLFTCLKILFKTHNQVFNIAREEVTKHRKLCVLVGGNVSINYYSSNLNKRGKKRKIKAEDGSQFSSKRWPIRITTIETKAGPLTLIQNNY